MLPGEHIQVKAIFTLALPSLLSEEEESLRVLEVEKEVDDIGALMQHGTDK
jgi:hypothetical protein